MTTRHARIVVPGDPSVVAFARDRVLRQVSGWNAPLDRDHREAVKLVASELITNAVVHSDGLVMVGLYYEPGEGRLLLVVHDGSPEPPERQNAEADDEGGRGLALVDCFAARNGWEETERGKKVWAEFEVPVPAPEPGRSALLRLRVQALAPRSYVHDVRPPLAMAAGL
ncbi:ATP-binding protein [Streptomyces sp. NPDC050485]|uniref:ATP-binding protein n=1 Tax=Streptomyces sp. NPDC050485 TaxID=3365617 RepID=UPI0037A4DE77